MNPNMRILRPFAHLLLARGLKVIAEGVASAAQWDAPCRWRCTEAQGYLISQPVAASAAAPMWQHGHWDGAAHKLRLPSAPLAQASA